MMNDFHNNIVFSPNIRDRGSNIIFDTCIRYDEHGIKTIEEALVNILEFVEMGSSCFSIFYYIKEKVI